jgi:hypothetical protein
LNMHFVMMMKEGMDTVQTGELVIDALLVLMAEDGRGVARTTAGAGRGGAQTMAREAINIALIMAVKQAQMVGLEAMSGVAPTMNGSVVKPVLIVIAMKLVLAGSAGKLVLAGSAGKQALAGSAGKQVLAMTGPPG